MKVKAPKIRTPYEDRVFVTSDGNKFDDFRDAGQHQAAVDMADWLTENFVVCGELEVDPQVLAVELISNWHIRSKNEE